MWYMTSWEKATKQIFVNKYWFDRNLGKLHFHLKACSSVKGAKKNVYLKRKNGEKNYILVYLKQMVKIGPLLVTKV